MKACDVHNIVHKADLKDLCGKKHTDDIMFHLKDKQVTNKVAVDQANHVRHLFWKPDLSKNFTRRYHNVLAIDCTDKTNTYNLPILHDLGITCTNQTISAAFGFLDGEAFHD